MTKAAVLPVPVRACPITSTPANARGMKPAWTGVGERYSALASDSIIRTDNPRSPNAASADGPLEVVLRGEWVGKGDLVWAEEIVSDCKRAIGAAKRRSVTQ